MDEWKPLKLEHKDIHLSHCLFADDIVLFGTASKNTIKCVEAVLNIFVKDWVKKINWKKSRFISSKDMPDNTRYFNTTRFGHLTYKFIW